MNILYVSCHSILEQDEVEMLSTFAKVDVVKPSDKEYRDVEPYDIIILCHRYQWLNFWDKIRHKRVIYRTIGQSSPYLENIVGSYQKDGLQIVRYSPMERQIQGYCGEDRLIRFGKDPEVFKKYNGSFEKCISFGNHVGTRPNNCKVDHILEVADVLHGYNNEEYKDRIETISNDYPALAQVYRDHRVYFYTGTWPASYTLTLIEAMMTGMPIISIGFNLWKENFPDFGDIFEVPYLLYNDLIPTSSDNIDQIKEVVDMFKKDKATATMIGQINRAVAVSLFNKHSIAEDWRVFLCQKL